MRTFLAYDGDHIANHKYHLYEISFWQGLKRLAQPRKYKLHLTMGRPIIVVREVWNK